MARFFIVLALCLLPLIWAENQAPVMGGMTGGMMGGMSGGMTGGMMGGYMYPTMRQCYQLMQMGGLSGMMGGMGGMMGGMGGMRGGMMGPMGDQPETTESP